MKKCHSNLIFLDVETTNFCPIRGDITSLGAIVTDGSLNEVASFYTTVKPEINQFTSEEALKVSGFTREALLLHTPQREACLEFMRFLKPFLSDFPMEMVSHTSNNFDWRFVDWMFRKQDLNYSLYKVLRHDFQLSTIKMGKNAGYDKNGLAAWADRLNLKFNHHNAIDDARACLEIYRFLKKQQSSLLLRGDNF